MVKYWKTMGKVGGVATILVVIGALNWLFVPWGFNLVHAIFGSFGILENIIYILVGLSAIFSIYALFLKNKR